MVTIMNYSKLPNMVLMMTRSAGSFRLQAQQFQAGRNFYSQLPWIIVCCRQIVGKPTLTLKVLVATIDALGHFETG